MDKGRQKLLEGRLQAILTELNTVCEELGLDVHGAAPAKVEAPREPDDVSGYDDAEYEYEEDLALFSSGQILLCWLGVQAVGFEASDVQELARMVEVTPAVDPRPELEGYINVRGHATPVIHLRHLMGQASRSHNAEQFLVLVRTTAASIAVVLDEVEDIFEVGEEHIHSRSELSIHRGLLKGVVQIRDQLVGVVDPQRLVDAAL